MTQAEVQAWWQGVAQEILDRDNPVLPESPEPKAVTKNGRTTAIIKNLTPYEFKSDRKGTKFDFYEMPF